MVAALLLGLFADASVNERGSDGLLVGGGVALLRVQALARAAAFGY